MEGLKNRQRKKVENQKDKIKTFEMCKNANIVSILFLTEWQPDRQIFSKLKYFFKILFLGIVQPLQSSPSVMWEYQSFENDKALQSLYFIPQFSLSHYSWNMQQPDSACKQRHKKPSSGGSEQL